MKKQDEGFTLIELLIVIVILGILATVVVFAVGGITDQGQESACKAELKTVEVAVEAYRAQELTYPTTITPAGLVLAQPAEVVRGLGLEQHRPDRCGRHRRLRALLPLI